MSNPSTTEYPANEPLLIPIKEDSQSLESPNQTKLFKGQIILNPGVSITNFITYLVFSAFNGIFLIPLGLLAMPLLGVVYELDATAREDISSIALLAQLVQKLITAPILGYICDKYGRKPMLLLGIFCIIASVATLPILPSVYPWYIVNLIVLEVGLACIMIAPLLADYIDDTTKGRVAGLVVVLVYTSSFLITYLNENVDLKHDIPLKYYELAGIGGFMFLLVAFGIKGGAYHKTHIKMNRQTIKSHILAQAPTQVYEEDAILASIGGPLPINGSMASQNAARRSQGGALASMQSQEDSNEERLSLTVGFKQMRNPWILAGFISEFLGIACVTLLNAVLTNYVSVITGDDSTNQAIILTNKHLLSAIFSAMFFGFFADKFNKFAMLILVTLISIGSVFLLIFSPTPFHPMAYASMVCFGIATGGFVTLMMQILSKYPHPKFRASVGAVGGMFAVFGSSSIGILGLYLMQYCIMMPFYLYLGFAGAGLGALTILYIAKRDVLSKS